MRISKLASEISESPTLALNEEARRLRERGEPVIHLGIGEPKNKAPIAAVLAGGPKLGAGGVSSPARVRMLCAQPGVVVPEDGTFHPRLEDIERAVGSYTKAIIVNSPNNPSGEGFSSEFISQIVDFCE